VRLLCFGMRCEACCSPRSAEVDFGPARPWRSEMPSSLDATPRKSPSVSPYMRPSPTDPARRACGFPMHLAIVIHKNCFTLRTGHNSLVPYNRRRCVRVLPSRFRISLRTPARPKLRASIYIPRGRTHQLNALVEVVAQRFAAGGVAFYRPFVFAGVCAVDDANEGVPVATNRRSGPILAPAFVTGCNSS